MILSHGKSMVMYIYRLALATFAMTLACSDCLLAQDSPTGPDSTRTEIVVYPRIGYIAGHSTYELDIGLGTDRLQSELEFPLNSVYLGGEMQIRSRVAERLVWEFSVGVSLTPGNPSGKMIDTDWAYLGNGNYDIWSYTESDPKGHTLQFSAEYFQVLRQGPTWTFGLIGGLDFVRLTQNLDNFAGWQIIDQNLNTHEFSVLGVPAIDYRVTYLAPEVGFRGTMDLGATLGADWRLLYGRVRATDEDDHLLRKKLSKGSGWGNQVRASLSTQLLLPRHSSKGRVFVGVECNFATLVVHGRQDQEFYEDVVEYDPIADQEYTIPKGTRFENLPHEFRSTRFEIGLRVGLTL